MANINKILIIYLAADLLFVLGGALLFGTALIFEAKIQTAPSLDSAPTILLFKQIPLQAAAVNAVFVFATFAISLPGVLMPDNRFWLKLQGWLIIVCAGFTLVLGLIIWYDTLQTRAELNVVWGQESTAMQSLLQQAFNCCGYLNSTSPSFVQDSTCISPLIAAGMPGCVGAFSNFSNSTLNLVFTAGFGIVALDVILLICVAVLLKDRKEKHRYRLIDAKSEFAVI
ncbi:hypothetical protein V8E54_006317 [Elaphomyces granulatus]